MRTRAAAVGLLLGAVAALPSCADSVPKEEFETLDALWQKAAARLPTYPPPFLWQRRETPPLPKEWPPARTTSWVRYAFAYGFDPVGLSDGLRVAAPYAVVTLDATAKAVAFDAARAAGSELGIQGVTATQPPSGAIDGDEVRRVEEAAAALRGPPAAGSREESALRAYYARWLAREGVVAGAVRPAHRDFFAWVEAGSAAAAAVP